MRNAIFIFSFLLLFTFSFFFFILLLKLPHTLLSNLPTVDVSLRLAVYRPQGKRKIKLFFFGLKKTKNHQFFCQEKEGGKSSLSSNCDEKKRTKKKRKGNTRLWKYITNQLKSFPMFPHSPDKNYKLELRKNKRAV